MAGSHPGRHRGAESTSGQERDKNSQAAWRPYPPVGILDVVVDTVFGLPLHPLVVHAVVVLVPLGALLVIAMAARPRWRTGPFAWLAVLLVLAATVATPVATRSGESLARSVGEPEQHASFGEALIYFMLPLLALTLALVLLAARARRAAGSREAGMPRPRSLVVGLVAASAAVAAVAATGQVAVIGHSGATATWSDVVARSASGR